MGLSPEECDVHGEGPDNWLPWSSNLYTYSQYKPIHRYTYVNIGVYIYTYTCIKMAIKTYTPIYKTCHIHMHMHTLHAPIDTPVYTQYQTCTCKCIYIHAHARAACNHTRTMPIVRDYMHRHVYIQVHTCACTYK